MGAATGLAIAGAGSITGGVLGSRSQKKAAERSADAITQAAQISADVQRQNFLDTAALNLGRAQAGDAATAQMMQLLGLQVPESLTSGAAYEQIFSGGGFGGGGVDPYAAYVDQNPDLQAEYARISGEGFGSALPRSYDADGDGVLDREEYGRFHYDKWGSAQGRELPGTGAGGVTNGLTGEYAIDVPELGAGGVSDLIKSTPGYQFRFDEGIAAVDSSAANRGMLMSGSQLRRLQEFGDEYAAREFGNYWNRLAGVAGAGQTATGDITGTGAATANNLANIYQNQGQHLASSYTQQGQAGANMWGGIGNTLAGVGTYVDRRWG